MPGHDPGRCAAFHRETSPLLSSGPSRGTAARADPGDATPPRGAESELLWRCVGLQQLCFWLFSKLFVSPDHRAETRGFTWRIATTFRVPARSSGMSPSPYSLSHQPGRDRHGHELLEKELARVGQHHLHNLGPLARFLQHSNVWFLRLATAMSPQVSHTWMR